MLADARLGAALACDRASGVCALTQQELTRSWNNRIPIAAMDRAEVRVRRGRGGSPQVFIVTRGGDYFFADYVVRSRADQVAQQINDFLGNPSADARLFVNDNERGAYWVAWAIVPVIVALLVVLARALFRKSPPAVPSWPVSKQTGRRTQGRGGVGPTTSSRPPPPARRWV